MIRFAGMWFKRWRLGWRKREGGGREASFGADYYLNNATSHKKMPQLLDIEIKDQFQMSTFDCFTCLLHVDVVFQNHILVADQIHFSNDENLLLEMCI